MGKSIFERTKEMLKKEMEKSKFFNFRKEFIECIDKKEDIDTCTITLHCEKKKFDVKVSFDLFYTSNGKIFKQNYKSFYGFEESEIPQYIVDQLNETQHCEIAFTFEELKQLYDEMAVKVIDKLSYQNILKQCKKEFDTVTVIDRTFYTRLEYYLGDKMVEQVHVGLISGIPSCEYGDIYPYKSKVISR